MTSESAPPLDVTPMPDGRIPPDLPHPRPFLARVGVLPHQLSRTVPHVSNIEYLRWIDRAAELHGDAAGYPRATLLTAGVMWFVARHEIDYQAEAWADDELVVATWVRGFARVKSWRETVIHRPADDRIVCRAVTLWVLVDLASRRPTRIPAAMQTAFDALDAAEVAS